MACGTDTDTGLDEVVILDTPILSRREQDGEEYI